MVHSHARGDDLSPPALWDVARDLFDLLVSLCGAPIALAGCIIMPDERADILAWLRPVEALARRLLLIEAAAVAPTLLPRRSVRHQAIRERRLVAQDMTDSALWRVSFRVSPAAPSAPSTNSGRGASEPTQAWPLAERMEAVSRVLANPAPFARRLAYRLMRTPKLARHLARPPEPGRRRGPADTAIAEASAQAALAVAAFDTS